MVFITATENKLENEVYEDLAHERGGIITGGFMHDPLGFQNVVIIFPFCKEQYIKSEFFETKECPGCISDSCVTVTRMPVEGKLVLAHGLGPPWWRVLGTAVVQVPAVDTRAGSCSHHSSPGSERGAGIRIRKNSLKSGRTL